MDDLQNYDRVIYNTKRMKTFIQQNYADITRTMSKIQTLVYTPDELVNKQTQNILKVKSEIENSNASTQIYVKPGFVVSNFYSSSNGRDFIVCVEYEGIRNTLYIKKDLDTLTSVEDLCVGDTVAFIIGHYDVHASGNNLILTCKDIYACPEQGKRDVFIAYDEEVDAHLVDRTIFNSVTKEFQKQGISPDNSNSDSDSEQTSGCLGVIIMVIIIIFFFKSCS